MSSSLNQLFAFALDFYRAPLQHQQQLHHYDPTTTTFTRFLEIASRPTTSDDLKNIAGELKKSPDTLHSAALFLIRQLLFAEKGNHYEVLGLSRSAGQDEIKKRYRALISLFHPDKNPEGEEWSQLYAPDLNEAYNVLKNATKRGRYDLSLSEPVRGPYYERNERSVRQQSAHPDAARADPVRSAASARTRTRSTPPLHSFNPSPLESIHRTTLWQKHPHLAIWGTALTILAIVILFAVLRTPDNILDLNSSFPGSGNGDDRRASMPRESSSANQTDDALNFALKQTAPSSTGSKSVDIGRWEEPAQELGKEEVSALIKKYMTEEERLKLSLQEEADAVATSDTAGSLPAQQTNNAGQAVDDISYPDALADYKSGQQRAGADLTTPVEPATGINHEKAAAAELAYSTRTDNTNQASARNTSAITATEQADRASAVGKQLPTAEQNNKKQINPVARTTPVTQTAVVTKKPTGKQPNNTGNSNTAAEKNTGAANKPASRLANDKIEYLIAQYITAYDSGNLDQMLRLFTANVKTDDGTGLAIIKRDYSNLFLNTAERRITVHNIKQQITGDGQANIRFDAAVRVRNTKTSSWKYFSGGMKLAVTDSERGLLISALSHSITQD